MHDDCRKENAALLALLPVVDFGSDRDNRTVLTEIGDHYVRHEFNLHGSGWIRLAYGTNTHGFEGHQFSNTGLTWKIACQSLPLSFREESVRMMALADDLAPAYDPIDWHIECKSGYRYPLDYFTDLHYGQIEGVDAKIPYDLSRCSHLVLLARAWKVTGEEKYRREILAQIVDWLAMNPCGYGIGWHANMNVALRLVNWLTAVSLIRAGIHLEDPKEGAFLKLFIGSLLDHRRFIAANLEFSDTNIHPNHYLGDLAGLLIGSRMIREFDRESDAWYRLAWREYQLEFNRQFGPDGVHFEGAVNYHCFSLEMLVETFLFAAKIDGCSTAEDVRAWLASRIGETNLRKLRQMFFALKAFIQPDGLIPIIGDNDSARFILFDRCDHDIHDWRFLCCIGAALFNDASLLPAGISLGHWNAAGIWLSGVHAVKPAEDPPASVAFRSVGFYFLRTPDIYGFVTCGPIGTDGLGGHSHDDKLSLVLSVLNRPFFVDYGNYTYTASLRLRQETCSVVNHNTVSLAGEPQNRRLANSPWWGCREDTRCSCLLWETSPAHVRFKGQHEGYRRLPANIVHRRLVEIDDPGKQVRLVDEMIRGCSDQPYPMMTISFLLHPECCVEAVNGNRITLANAGIKLELTTENGQWLIEESFYAPRYGVRLPATRIMIRLSPGAAQNMILAKWHVNHSQA
ncbi:MAG TPA: hypothetical protein DD640_08180 [Clostridiales bacterium]|nr:hypothetical protein [Clostridiales bacterium]